jgi:hypothetical protein
VELGDETIFGMRRNHPETGELLPRLCVVSVGWASGTATMIEIAAILIGVFSAGIFLAHAVDAYHAQ